MSGAHPLFVTSLFLCLISISTFHPTYSKPNGGFSLKLIPRDSPESPLYPGNLTVVERIQRMIKFTEARAHILDLISSSNYSTIEPNNLSLIRDSFFYMVQVGIGTPVEFQFLLMDTGGGLIWTQCQPCINCYRQTKTHIFVPSQSSTYRRLPCDHPLCHGDLPLYQCVNDECVYNIGYGGGSSTRGVVSYETFTFPLDATRTIDNMIFGCSNDNRNIQFSIHGVISGIMGLSLSPDSLVSQLADQTQRRFSYCLVPFTEAQMQPSVLRFGDTIPLPSSNVYTTPFVTPGGSNYYHLNLLDISVGMRPLMFPPGTFTARIGFSGGFFIDSGALISQLDQNLVNERNVYREVMRAFQNHYDSFHLQRLGRVPEGFPLCYKYPPEFNQFASLTYQLEGGNYVVDPKYVNFYNTQAGYFCVAMMPGTGKSILGAWHQQNMRVTYNGAINSLQFSTETCANDHP
ncbi:aspartic proteinase nepenthesin-2 [Prunus persica]|nr:aspartic proteinase nepenthesin-2 [Prunus persica]